MDKKMLQRSFIILNRFFNEFTGNSTMLRAIEFHLLKRCPGTKARLILDIDERYDRSGGYRPVIVLMM